MRFARLPLLLLALLAASPAKAVAPLIFVIPVAAEVAKVLGIVGATVVLPALGIHAYAQVKCGEEINPYLLRCEAGLRQYMQPDQVVNPVSRSPMQSHVGPNTPGAVVISPQQKADLNQRCPQFRKLDECLQKLQGRIRQHRATHPDHKL